MRTEIAPGRTSDDLGFDPVLADTLTAPGVLPADSGDDADSIREKTDAREMLTQLPMHKSR